ncbi:MAG: toprim domain-containing protein [Methylobacterium sp.]|nr:toprim domain-containing protein [Methylobacterium sp.]
MRQGNGSAGSPARELSLRLAERVEDVCRYYLSNGVRSGGYWIVGDTGNAKGRSLFVRLTGPTNGKGARGKWQDAATGEHGDLLDLIAARESHRTLAETLDEARRFLGEPRSIRQDGYARVRPSMPSRDTTEIARRIWTEGRPITGTLAETYLGLRHLAPPFPRDLRFHPALNYRDDRNRRVSVHPALLAAVRDAKGGVRGIQRTWLALNGEKAVLDDPRRSLGRLNGHGVWLRPGDAEAGSPALLIGEGVETVLSLAELFPRYVLVAALSAAHLAAFDLPAWVRQLLIARDNDPAGNRAARRLARRAEQAGLAVTILRPVLKDFNADRRLLGPGALISTLRRQIPLSLTA